MQFEVKINRLRRMSTVGFIPIIKMSDFGQEDDFKLSDIKYKKRNTFKFCRRSSASYKGINRPEKYKSKKYFIHNKLSGFSNFNYCVNEYMSFLKPRGRLLRFRKIAFRSNMIKIKSLDATARKDDIWWIDNGNQI